MSKKPKQNFKNEVLLKKHILAQPICI